MWNAMIRPPWPIGDRDEFRRSVHRWIEQNWDTSITVRAWWRRLAEAGLGVPTWPKTAGGLGATVAVQQIIEEELASAGAIAPPQGAAGVRIVAPTLRQHASFAQTAEWFPALARGEEAWCLLITEDGAGDDLMPLGTMCVTDRENRWWLDGAKQHVTDAAIARRGLLLARSDKATEHTDRHGLTCFVLDMDEGGVEGTTADDGTATVVFDQVKLTDDTIVGHIGGGWQIARTAIAHGQSSLGGRIRRGLIEVTSGEKAGNLDRTVADVLATHVRQAPPEHDRRERRSRD